MGHHYETQKEPPSVEIKCRLENTLAFVIPPSKEAQIVVIIEDNSPKSILNFVLVKPGNESGEINTPSGNHTLWTAVMNSDGRPSFWKKNRYIQSWTTLPPTANKTYVASPTFRFDKYEPGSSDIDAELVWNTTDPTDMCFEVFNRCESYQPGNAFKLSIRPNQRRLVALKDLPLDDICTITILGKYGRTDFDYQTPSCHDIPGCLPIPDKIENISVSVTEMSSESWSVHVQWLKPIHPPNYYIVTLRAENDYEQNVTGSASEVTFPDVHEEGRYYVSVFAFTESGKSGNGIHDFFPLHEEHASVSLLVGAWAAVAVMSVAFVVAFVWWKRYRDIKKRNMYFPGLTEKTKESDAESESVWEDGWEVRAERVVLHELVGEGAFGVVRRATLAPDNRDVAVKMLKDFPSVEEIRSFRAEMELMKSVGSHPHIVSLVGCCRGRKPFIIAEYCSRGDLLTYLRCSWDLMVTKRNAKYYNNNKEFDYRDDIKYKRDSRLVINRLYDLQGVCDTELTVLDLLSFCRQIAMGMEFLSSNRVVHRDLAARNILVTADRTLKIADFGLSRDIYQDNQYKQKGNGKMPVKWMALESLTHRIYTTQSDVWSFGVVMWEVVTVGGAPYAAVSAARLPRLLRAGYRMPRPPNCSPLLYEVMLSCWHARPRSRPTFGELHARLDELLCAGARHYLELARPDDEPPPSPTPQRYVRMIVRGKWPWSKRSYNRSNTANNYSPAGYKLSNSLQTD
ncbi:tyrosine-protein kinase receptor torso-like [Zerene cesonia]|uniref:tyrosine-protein kinase receptor torso-like n=1 Tax=Zerene cesonia TaxID=33412 RepID=UPI0018E4F5DC|nr:tyrosine-protein kinase receptor torso-like [Zerene cesonia]